MADELPHLMRTYTPPSVGFVRGNGVYLFDRSGRRYLDFISGLGVNILGHCPPAVVRAIQRQSETLIHSSNLYRIEGQVRLARRLCEASFADRAFFCNSGAEAVDTVIKTARRFFFKKGDRRRNRVIAFEGSFHGRTYGALSATSKDSAREGFEPVVPNIDFARFNDLGCVKTLLGDQTALVLVEPILGEGGVVPATRPFLNGLRRMCAKHGALLAFDEVQCGLGRVGRTFAYQHFGVEPDMLTLGKGLAGGLPMAAVLAREPVAGALDPGTHGSTFGGNPVSCAAALAACRRLLDERFAAAVASKGRYLMGLLRDGLRGRKSVRQIRGIGLMIGIEMSGPAAGIVDECREHGLLINCTAERVLRMLPPLVVRKSHCRKAVAIIVDAINASKTD